MPSLPVLAAVGLVVVLPAALLTLKLLVLDPYLGPKLEAIALELHPQTLRERVRERQRRGRSAADAEGGDDDDGSEGLPLLLSGEAVGVLIDDIDDGDAEHDRAIGHEGLRRRRPSRSLESSRYMFADGAQVPSLLSGFDRRPSAAGGATHTSTFDPLGSRTLASAADENAGRRHPLLFQGQSRDRSADVGVGERSVTRPWPDAVDGTTFAYEQCQTLAFCDERRSIADAGQHSLVDLSSLEPAQPSLAVPAVQSPLASLLPAISAASSHQTPPLSPDDLPPTTTLAEKTSAIDPLSDSWADVSRAIDDDVDEAVDEGASTPSTSSPSRPLPAVLAPEWPPSALATPVAVDSFSFAFDPPPSMEERPVDDSADSSFDFGSDQSTSPSRPSSPTLSTASSSTAASAILVDRPPANVGNLRAAAVAVAGSEGAPSLWTPTGSDDGDDDGWSEVGSVA